MGDKTPVYDGIKQDLKDRIARMELVAGDRVPSEIALARLWGVNRSQTRLALRELEVEGYLIRRQGSGSYVAPRVNRRENVPMPGARAVAIAIPKTIIGHSHRVVEGFLARAAREDVHVITYHLDNDHTTEAEEHTFLQSVISCGVSGFVAWIGFNSPGTQALVRDLAERRFPVVLVDRRLPGVKVDSVVSDNRRIGYDLTNALIERGHQRIGFAGTEARNPTSVLDRFEGYRAALSAASLPLDPGYVLSMDRLDADPAAEIRSVMSLRNRPTAIVCTHIRPVRFLLRELKPLGYTVPEHLELAVVDDEYPAALPDLKMIRISQQSREMGAQSAELMLARMADGGRPIEQRVLAPCDVLTSEPQPAVHGCGASVERRFARKKW